MEDTNIYIFKYTCDNGIFWNASSVTPPILSVAVGIYWYTMVSSMTFGLVISGNLEIGCKLKSDYH